MSKKEILLQRLDEIGKALQKTGSALALLGQGSVGPELERLDEYSDLDFIIIVPVGCKNGFLDQLDWLGAVHPLAYFFKIAPEGYKLLFADGIFCEFAIFEPADLETPAFVHGTWSAVGRVIWKADDFTVPEVLLEKREKQAPARPRDWLLGEALTNLYVGLLRYQRGEKLSAARFIQSYAIDRIIELSELIEQEKPVAKDSYTIDRRYEQRFPLTANRLPQFMQGYDRSVESAREILSFFDKFDIDREIKELILALTEKAAQITPAAEPPASA